MENKGGVWSILAVVFWIVIMIFNFRQCVSCSSEEDDATTSKSYKTESSGDWQVAPYRGKWFGPNGKVWLDFFSDTKVDIYMGNDEVVQSNEYAYAGSSMGVMFYAAGSVMNLSPEGVLYFYDKNTRRRTMEVMELHRR